LLKLLVWKNRNNYLSDKKSWYVQETARRSTVQSLSLQQGFPGCIMRRRF